MCNIFINLIFIKFIIYFFIKKNIYFICNIFIISIFMECYSNYFFNYYFNFFKGKLSAFEQEGLKAAIPDLVGQAKKGVEYVKSA